MSSVIDANRGFADYYDEVGPEERPRNGRIITFYSFKGGVGRTMALANTAFLAASSGKKVLVMDWDLEAPGLAYYFRGVQEPAVARDLRAAPGVLNFLWEWVNRVGVNTKEAVEEATSAFASGAPFRNCVRELVAPEFFQDIEATVDYIGCGSPKIDTPEPTYYEDALARFPWPAFFSEMAGGFVSQALRDWAKQHYDLVLIDSRTGLAESAGVCTMHLPDAVALCFVLNRQNIEGISKIASVIRSTKPEIELMAAPMRVAREGTSEESDARAKAITDLTRLGGFDIETATHQLQALALKHADNVPFYESLAPIVAVDMDVDALCINYLRFAREVTRLDDLNFAPLDEELVSRARARLRPQWATSDYVAKLIGSEPLRAITELEALVSSAEELVAIGEHDTLDDDYLLVLIKASFEPRTLQFQERSFSLQVRGLNILRMLQEVDSKWSGPLSEALEIHLLTNAGQVEIEDEIALREELDGFYQPSLLAVSEIKRLENRRRIAWLTFWLGDTVVTPAVEHLFPRIYELRKSGTLGPSADDDLLFIEADLLLLKGRFALLEDDFNMASELLNCATAITAELDWDSARAELKRTVAEAHSLLATKCETVLKIEDRRRHAVKAARINGAGLSPNMFCELLGLLCNENSVDGLRTFVDATLASAPNQPRTSNLVLHLGRSHQYMERFLDVATAAVALLQPLESAHDRSVMQRLASMADAMIVQVSRRRQYIYRDRPADIVDLYRSFALELARTGFELVPNLEVDAALELLARPRPERSSLQSPL